MGEIMNYVIVSSVVLQIINFWFIIKQRIVFPLVILNYVLYMVVEGWLALRDPDQTLIWLYCVLNAWAIWCGVVGWRNQIRRSLASTDI